jgi:hypothetical protein
LCQSWSFIELVFVLKYKMFKVHLFSETPCISNNPCGYSTLMKCRHQEIMNNHFQINSFPFEWTSLFIGCVNKAYDVNFTYRSFSRPPSPLRCLAKSYNSHMHSCPIMDKWLTIRFTFSIHASWLCYFVLWLCALNGT